MEPINTKLYEKYKNLKRRRLLEEEEWIRERDVDLRSYQSATEDLIEELKNENERLRAELSSMQQQYSECENLLLQESKKSKELSDEVGRLEILLSESNEPNDTAMFRSPNTTPGAISRETSKDLERTKAINSLTDEVRPQHVESAAPPTNSCQEDQIVPHCCRGNFTISGDTSEDGKSCVFKTLINFLIGMDFSVDSQAEGICIMVIHQSSGYTFTLTSVQEGGGEGELKYRASSLGTLERVALDWMKDEIVFSMTMSRVFFDRISRVIGRC